MTLDYDDDDDIKSFNMDISASAEFARYEEFLRRELPPLMRGELETRIEMAIDPIEETLRGQIVDIVRDLQLRLFQNYRESRLRQPSRELVPSSSSSRPPETDSRPDPERDTDESGLDNDLAAFLPPPDFPNFFDDFNGVFFDFPAEFNLQDSSDSGYRSGQNKPDSTDGCRPRDPLEQLVLLNDTPSC